MTDTIKKAYAEALFELGQEEGRLEALNDEISSVAGVFKENPDYLRMLSSPSMKAEDKTESIRSVFSGKISETALNFLCITAEKDRVRYILEIAKELDALVMEKLGIADISVTTPIPLSDRLRTALIEKLRKVTGKDVRLRESVDPALIGGVVLSYDGTRLDSSVRTKLDGLRHSVKNIIA